MKYRLGFQNGVLVRQRKGVLFFWRWYYNRCEEDDLTKLKNRITSANRQLAADRRLLPQLEARLKARKDALTQYMQQANAKAGPEWNDSWSPRRAPLALLEDHASPKKKKQRDDKPMEPAEIARLVVSPKK